MLNCAFNFKMKYPWSWQVHYWKTRISRSPGQWASRCVLSKSLSVVCEWRYPLDHRNTIISTHWHHSALHSSSATTPLHGSHTPPPASCSTIIVFSGQPIVCEGACWTMSPIFVQTMIQHCYCDPSFSHLTGQDGVPVWLEEGGPLFCLALG